MNLTLPITGKNIAIARRIIWFEPPETALQNASRFMAYACRYATHEDMKHLRSQMTDQQFRDALDAAPPGIIDPRSWHYWNLKLGRYPPPPLPTRQLEETTP